MQITRFKHNSGRGILLVFLSIAMLLAAHMRAGAQDNSVFVSARIYDGVDPADQKEITRATDEGFLPIMRESEGFVGYYLLPAGDMLAAVSLFDSAEQAAASNEKARDFVAENLAPLLPNSPLIVEGTIDVMYVADDDGMMDDASSLYATLRIYHIGNMQDIEESNRLVEAHLLPALQESGGLFSYYSLNDGVDTIAGLNVYASEEKALAANDIAAAFVTEHMMDWLPDDPMRVNGQLGVAALAELHMGANLIDDMMNEEQVFVSIRVYDGVDPADQEEILRRTDEGFLPIMRESDGFVAYYLLPAGDRLAAVSFFDTPEQASASNAAARDFVTEKLAPLLPNPPQITEGGLDVMYVTDEMMGEGSLYGALRVYDNYDLTDRDVAVKLVETGFLPILQGADGLFSYFTMDDGVDRVVALSVYDTKENALAANALAADFVAEYMSQWIPEEPTRINGRLGVAALADVHMGDNLINDMMNEGQVFVSTRLYDGVDPADQEEIARLVDEGFLPTMRESAGFVAYYLLPAGDRLAAVSFFDTEEQAAASNEKARDFVVESLAPLLPNPPQIVEGLVEVMYVADADEMMMDEDMTQLHAVLAIYDGFDMTRLDETVELVESVFLPALRENGGLVSYYGIGDGVDKAIALRITTSQESLQQGSDIAADFVAEYLADWLPEDPISISGQLGVAALADTQMGANLAEYSQDEASVFASVRVYDGVDPASQDAIARLTAEGFLPIMRASGGFVGYYLLAAGDKLAAVSLFDSAEQASASNAAAREFVAENLAPLLPNAPLIIEGPLSTNYVAAPSASDDHGGVGELHGSIRFYEGFDLRHFDEANDLAITHLLPALQELGGLFAQFAFNDGEDTVVGISIFEGEEAALAANDAGKAFTIEHLADWAPNPPTGVAGKIAIAALAEIDMGANLIGDA